MDSSATQPSVRALPSQAAAPGRAGDGGEPDSPPGRSRRAQKVSEYFVGCEDERGAPIEEIYYKRSSYVVYLADSQVTVRYADDNEAASTQIALTADLILLRDKLQFMISGRDIKGCYRRHIADALRLALEGKAVIAQQILECAIEDILGYKARVGRTAYLMFAGPVALLVCATLLVGGVLALLSEQQAIGLLLFASSGGAMGALLSIAIALRTRTVAVDDDLRANRLDGMIRLLIGVISGGALFLVLVTGVVANISIATMRTAQVDLDSAWQAALIIGFAAGFFERLVPDLLEKSLERKPKVTGSLEEKGSRSEN